MRTPTVQDIVREAAGYLPGACRRTTKKGDKMPLKETFNCDHNKRCPPGSRARREPARATSPTGTGAIGTEALPCLYLIKRAWNRPNSSNSCGKHGECYYRRPDNQDICLQYLCYQTTA
ncbi:hypothetical protein Bbelb_080980 [Branchiostoma belcheri]|nr:hypothetical protein Bbelb_080980 [Branchiostoma belcheri]